MIEIENNEITKNENVLTDETIDITEHTDNGETITETLTEYVYVKENRPLFETPLSDYSVTEGLLLLIFVVTVLNNIFKTYIKG